MTELECRLFYLKERIAKLKKEFDPSQARDDHGRWTADLALHKEKWEKKGVRNFVADRPKRNEVQLSDLVVPKEQQGQGLGSQYMKEFTSLADKHGKTITLTPALRDKHYGSTSQSRLKTFYGRYGFVQNKGHNTDYTISDTMYRRPK